MKPTSKQSLRTAIANLISENASENASDAVSETTQPYWYPLNHIIYGESEIAAACEAMCAAETTMGKRVQQFEREFANMHNAKHAIMVNSGSSADLLIAFALVDRRKHQLARGDEVICPAVTWPTQITSLLMAGLNVRLVDVDPSTLQINLDDLESNINQRTRAVSTVHLLGNSCDMTRLVDICRRHNLILLEDCCESLGTKHGGNPVGTFGKASAFSFFFSHHITTMEGGMIITNDDEWAETFRLLRSHGWSRVILPNKDVDFHERYNFLNWGLNVRPLEVSGAFGLVQLQRLPEFANARKANAMHFRHLVSDLESEVQLMAVTPQVDCSWFALPLLVSEHSPVKRNELAQRLEEAGVETRPIVAGNLARQSMSALFPELKSGELPGADAIHERGLYIGLHPFESPQDIQQLFDILKQSLTPTR